MRLCPSETGRKCIGIWMLLTLRLILITSLTIFFILIDLFLYFEYRQYSFVSVGIIVFCNKFIVEFIVLFLVYVVVLFGRIIDCTECIIWDIPVGWTSSFFCLITRSVLTRVCILTELQSHASTLQIRMLSVTRRRILTINVELAFLRGPKPICPWQLAC